jgi:hypothetical protein
MLDKTAQTVLIRGGRYFQEPTEACLLGAAVGRRIQIGRVTVGEGIGIAVGQRCFVTSPVTSIELQVEERTGTV